MINHVIVARLEEILALEAVDLREPTKVMIVTPTLWDPVFVQWVGMQLKKAKKKGKGAALEVVNEDFIKFKQIKVRELERLEKIAMLQEESNQRQKEATQKHEEANQLMKEKTRAKKMKMWLKLSEKKHHNDHSQELLKQLSDELFES